jgi:cyclic pyranopterin phosphate synthase
MPLEDKMLTHLDQNNQPTMVDVTDKSPTIRMARAQTSVQLPEEIRPYLSGQELLLKKGPVFQTAIISGTMAAKRTHEMIPFCHQIPVESCKLSIDVNDDLLVTVSCQVKTTFKTGVEMEALHGATIAALTIYDMCKAVSHNIVIKDTKLIAKTGGKHTLIDRPLYGLILTGGKSERMGEPKALINYHGKPHAAFMHELMDKYCDRVYFSARKDQWKGSALEAFPTIEDSFEGGPMAALLSAFKAHPDVNWMIAACDLVHFNQKTIEKLLASFNPDAVATSYANSEKGFPEALCAIYTPKAQSLFLDAFKSDIRCPVKVLKTLPVELVKQEAGINLANINTPEEREHARH